MGKVIKSVGKDFFLWARSSVGKVKTTLPTDLAHRTYDLAPKYYGFCGLWQGQKIYGQGHFLWASSFSVGKVIKSVGKVMFFYGQGHLWARYAGTLRFRA